MQTLHRRTLLALGASTFALAACGGGGGATVTADDMSMGDANAKVTVVEYASLACGHCAEWNKTVFPEFKAKYIDTGKVRYVFREFITQPPQLAVAGTLLARCAGKDKYFTVIDALFHSQEEALTGGPRDVLLRVARTAGLSEEQVSTCLGDEKAVLAQAERFTTGLAKEVSATPTFFINDQKLESEVPLAQIDKAYEAAMAKAK